MIYISLCQFLYYNIISKYIKHFFSTCAKRGKQQMRGGCLDINQYYIIDFRASETLVRAQMTLGGGFSLSTFKRALLKHRHFLPWLAALARAIL